MLFRAIPVTAAQTSPGCSARAGHRASASFIQPHLFQQKRRLIVEHKILHPIGVGLEERIARDIDPINLVREQVLDDLTGMLAVVDRRRFCRRNCAVFWSKTVVVPDLSAPRASAKAV